MTSRAAQLLARSPPCGCWARRTRATAFLYCHTRRKDEVSALIHRLELKLAPSPQDGLCIPGLCKACAVSSAILCEADLLADAELNALRTCIPNFDGQTGPARLCTFQAKT